MPFSNLNRTAVNEESRLCIYYLFRIRVNYKTLCEIGTDLNITKWDKITKTTLFLIRVLNAPKPVYIFTVWLVFSDLSGKYVARSELHLKDIWRNWGTSWIRAAQFEALFIIHSDRKRYIIEFITWASSAVGHIY